MFVLCLIGIAVASIFGLAAIIVDKVNGKP